jgi:hypothetical protein
LDRFEQLNSAIAIFDLHFPYHLAVSLFQGCFKHITLLGLAGFGDRLVPGHALFDFAAELGQQDDAIPSRSNCSPTGGTNRLLSLANLPEPL